MKSENIKYFLEYKRSKEHEISKSDWISPKIMYMTKRGWKKF